jgi:arylsulfatase
METVDEEFLGASLDFIDRADKDKKPFFVWFNSTRMHIYTHLKPESVGKTGLGVEADGMVEHDGQVGTLLKKLDDLGIADNTIVIYTTDNGAETFSWPDGGTTPFRSEKNSNWEGGYRVPAVVRWPGTVKPHTEINGIFASEDWVPTLTAAAGEPDVAQKLLDGYDAAGKTFKVHLDGFDQHDLLAGGPKAPCVLLLDRRRRPRGTTLRSMEGRVPRAESRGAEGLAGSAGSAPGAFALQPSHRPVRTRPR